LVGRTERVLVERRGKNGDYMGRTEHNEIVHFACSVDVIGSLVPTLITAGYNNSLRGELASDFDVSAVRPRSTPERAVSAPSRRALPVLAGL
jgi:hypothetical protein